MRLVAAPILRRPIRGRPFQLHTDWSILGLGMVLTQCGDEGKEFVVAYASRSNNATESCYSLYERVVYAFLNRMFSHFGAPAKVLTD